MPEYSPESTLILPSPCKINLFLHINGKRPDGYHELQTLFQLLDYGDTVTLKAQDTLEVSPALPNVPQEQNLAFRAARLLQESTGCTQGARIIIDKKLPMGGGIGGGSSNAATTLLGLNRLWKTGLSVDALARLGRELGADVPVFVMGRTAWGEGVGEILTPVQRTNKWYLVIKPECEINTAKIFSNKGLTRDTPKLKIAPALEGQATTLSNDCEAVVLKEYQDVARAMDWLGQFKKAKLTGTGACIFAEFTEQLAASKVLESIPECFEGFVAKGVNVSPLHKALEK